MSGAASPSDLTVEPTHKKRYGAPITAPLYGHSPLKASTKLILARCRCYPWGNSSTGFITAPEVASVAARLMSQNRNA